MPNQESSGFKPAISPRTVNSVNAQNAWDGGGTLRGVDEEVAADLGYSADLSRAEEIGKILSGNYALAGTNQDQQDSESEQAAAREFRKGNTYTISNGKEKLSMKLPEDGAGKAVSDLWDAWRSGKRDPEPK